MRTKARELVVPVKAALYWKPILGTVRVRRDVEKGDARVVPAEECENAHQDLPGDLDGYIGDEEGLRSGKRQLRAGRLRRTCQL
jgi:hypothetical protein